MDETGMDLMRWLGRREAFAAIAGRCSAAAAESLRRIRDSKMHKQLGMPWDEFCPKRLGVSRRNVERILRPLDEFGPSYYHVAEITHVTPDEYRAIASYVSAEGVKVDGAVIALLPENSEQISAAVAKLLDREKPEAKHKPALSFGAVLKRCEALAEAVAVLEGPLEPTQQLALTTAVSRLRRAAAQKGAATL